MDYLLEIMIHMAVAYFQIVVIVIGSVMCLFGISCLVNLRKRSMDISRASSGRSKSYDISMALTLTFIGGGLASAAAFLIPMSNATWVIWAATIIGLMFRFRKYLNPKELRDTLATYRNKGL